MALPTRFINYIQRSSLSSNRKIVYPVIRGLGTPGTFLSFYITKTSLFKYTENFSTKNENFQIKSLIFFIFLLKNIDCGYSLELPAQKHRLLILVRTALARRF